ncbi:MAG: polyprenyl synthetase family protein [Planctomycetota bacterium]
MSDAAPLRDLLEVVRPELDRINRELPLDLAAARPELTPLLDHVAGYRGKQLRPALVFLAARAVGEVGEEHFTVAKVVELLHTATLVHDDVLDGATLRRQLTTLHELHGNELSVLLGDYLYARAFQMAVTLDDPACSRVLAETTRVVCQGEITQLVHRFDFDWTEARYEQVIDDKTASLFGAAARLGAHYAGAFPGVGDALDAYGRGLGVAFQIVDDCLDLTGEEAVVGKSLGTDLESGKLTLPLLFLMEQEPVAVARLRGLVGRPGALPRLADEFDLAPAVAFAMKRAGEHVDRAIAALDAVPAGLARETLVELARYVVRRSR